MSAPNTVSVIFCGNSVYSSPPRPPFRNLTTCVLSYHRRNGSLSPDRTVISYLPSVYAHRVGTVTWHFHYFFKKYLLLFLFWTELNVHYKPLWMWTPTVDVCKVQACTPCKRTRINVIIHRSDRVVWQFVCTVRQCRRRLRTVPEIRPGFRLKTYVYVCFATAKIVLHRRRLSCDLCASKSRAAPLASRGLWPKCRYTLHWLHLFTRPGWLRH